MSLMFPLLAESSGSLSAARSAFAVWFPAFMLVMPAMGLVFWCWLTNLRLPLRPMFVTLIALLLFGLSSWLLGPAHAAHPWHAQLWGMGGFFLVFFVFVFPYIRRTFDALPEPEGVATLRTRKLELYPGAWVLPWVAWSVLVVAIAMRGVGLLGWLSPVLGGVSLLVLRPLLRFGVREPEPLGGSDPEALAARYVVFRRRRLGFLYVLFVVLALFVTATPLMWGWKPVIVGPVIGLSGGLFGIWCDAQRYLLRRQLAGQDPPLSGQDSPTRELQFPV